MLDFCARQDIEALTAPYPMSLANEAKALPEANTANYRGVVENDAVLPSAGATCTQPGRGRPQVLVYSGAR